LGLCALARAPAWLRPTPAPDPSRDPIRAAESPARRPNPDARWLSSTVQQIVQPSSRQTAQFCIREPNGYELYFIQSIDE
jgi:hypothetical protein